MKEMETKMKELMDFVKDVTEGLYYMKQSDVSACYPIDGKSVSINISITVRDEVRKAIRKERGLK